MLVITGIEAVEVNGDSVEFDICSSRNSKAFYSSAFNVLEKIEISREMVIGTRYSFDGNTFTIGATNDVSNKLANVFKYTEKLTSELALSEVKNSDLLQKNHYFRLYQQEVINATWIKRLSYLLTGKF